ncbi:hypothetical protein [Actinotignum urinale]|uniref:Uncharacterized protein n=1 Tax=Actinotignum urinale TaxID=190146 RepID=A0ABU5G7E4_9ACTO|nr:hypothetical protein [Actinotignum urinale]MDY5132580.1 hypothetical protein [Actinotignum urinale]
MLRNSSEQEMSAMSAPQFTREATYRATMLAATKAAKAGILTDTDVNRIRGGLIARNLPPIGRLHTALVLDKTNAQSDI